MKKLAILISFLLFTFATASARSQYCLDSAPALAGSVVLGTIFTFFLVLILAKLLPKKNKLASCLTNILILVLWIVACYFVCFLIRMIFY